MLRYMILAEAATGVHRPDPHRYAQFMCSVRAFWRRAVGLMR